MTTSELYLQRWIQVCLGLGTAEKITGGIARVWCLSKLNKSFTQTWTAYQVYQDHFFFLCTNALVQRVHVCIAPWAGNCCSMNYKVLKSTFLHLSLPSNVKVSWRPRKSLAVVTCNYYLFNQWIKRLLPPSFKKNELTDVDSYIIQATLGPTVAPIIEAKHQRFLVEQSLR